LFVCSNNISIKSSSLNLYILIPNSPTKLPIVGASHQLSSFLWRIIQEIRRSPNSRRVGVERRLLLQSLRSFLLFSRGSATLFAQGLPKYHHCNKFPFLCFILLCYVFTSENTTHKCHDDKQFVYYFVIHKFILLTIIYSTYETQREFLWTLRIYPRTPTFVPHYGVLRNLRVCYYVTIF